MSGKIWLCPACGKQGTTRETVGDESCYLYSVEVWTASIKYDAAGHPVSAQSTSQPFTEAQS